MTAQPLSVLIVDDEPPARQRLEQLIAELPDWRAVGACGSGEEALALVGELAPSVVLLDIRMPGMGGLEAAHHLSALAHPPAVIFTTAYDRYALEAFDSHAVGYLLKPIRLERLADALRRAVRLETADIASLRGAQQPPVKRRHIAVRVRDQLRLIPVQDILFFRADQKYVTIVHREGEDLTDESLKELGEELAPDFARVHRSFLVAVHAVQAVERDPDGHAWLRLRDTQAPRIPVSRRQQSELKKRLGASR